MTSLILKKSHSCCSATETLNADDKFFCDKCKSLQDAEKVMKIRALPRVLCLHLKRFKYIEQLDRCACILLRNRLSTL